MRVWSDGSTYEGEWWQGQPAGFGVHVGAGPAAQRYEGRWAAGRRCGRGVASWGHTGGGVWSCPLGHRHGGGGGRGAASAAPILLPRCVYDGEWQGDAPHGEGTHTCSDGRQHAGQWLRGQPHGAGRRVLLPRALWMPLPDPRDPIAAPQLAPATVLAAGMAAGVPLDAHARLRVVEGAWDKGVLQGRVRVLLNKGDVVEGSMVDGVLEGPANVTFLAGRSVKVVYKRGAHMARV